MKTTILILALVLAAPLCARAQGQTQFPASLDTATTLPQAVDYKATYLTAPVTNSATTLTVNSTAGLPSTVVAQVDSELLACSVTNATTLTCSRAFSGTTAAAHSANAAMRFPLTSAHVNGTRGAVEEIEKKLGTGASNASSAATGTALRKQSDGTTAWEALPAGNPGTVTSVGLALPSIFSVSNSPVTTSGTLTGSLVAQSAHAVFVGPTSGTAAPTFRALVSSDLPSHTHSSLDAGSGSNTLTNGSASNATVVVKNTDATAFTGVEYHNSAGTWAVFTGYSNASPHFRFNTNGHPIRFMVSGTTRFELTSTGAALTLGSDATGDLFYRNSSGQLARLGIGATNKVLKVSGGLPSWGDATTTGTCTLSAGVCTISLASVTANSRIFLTAQDNNSTGALRVSGRSAGVSFTVTSSNGADSGVVAYQIVEP